MRTFIPVSAPAFVGNEKKYVMDCIESSWISSTGKYIEKFESAFAEFCSTKYALSCCNGTVALHLALLALNVQAGDEVIIPTLTYVATANAVAYCGATPIFVDSERETWNIDPDRIVEKITPRTKGIIVVHLYGHPADMDAVISIARQHNLFVIEDAAEAHGAEYRGRKVGSLGNVATFSFYGNKIITSGEGGMVVTDDTFLAQRVRLFKGQGMDLQRRYWFPVIGFNYRMTNVAAAIGLAQLEKIEWHLKRRREVAAEYARHLRGVPGISLQVKREWARPAYWMNSVVLNEQDTASRDKVILGLSEAGIETRPFFYPMHTLPMYTALAKGYAFPIAEELGAKGISLPSHATLTADDVGRVVNELRQILDDRIALKS